jgi:hypothetical protein
MYAKTIATQSHTPGCDGITQNNYTPSQSPFTKGDVKTGIFMPPSFTLERSEFMSDKKQPAGLFHT